MDNNYIFKLKYDLIFNGEPSFFGSKDFMRRERMIYYGANIFKSIPILTEWI